MESEPMICSAPNSEGKSLLSGEGEVNNKDEMVCQTTLMFERVHLHEGKLPE